MNTDLKTRLRRALLILCALAAIWAVAVALTGGFVVYLNSVRVSSRNPRNAAVIALLSALAVWALTTPDERRKRLDELLSWTGAVSVGISARSRRWRWLQWVSPATIVALVGVGLEIYQWAGARPLWLDEEMVALNLRDRRVGDLAGTLWLGQSAPLGWLVVQRAVLLMFGTSELALRLVPGLFGIATLAGAVWVGHRWMSPVGAAVLALLCSFGQWLSYYSLELKHYSADTFWGLLLPALAAWAMDSESDRSAVQTRRVAVWWAAAAVGHWFANGALLVTPACALVLFVVLSRRGGWRAACRVTLLGLVWLASFGPHYVLAVRHTMSSAYLRDYWSFAMAPASLGLDGTLAWLASQLEPFALKPGGTGLWLMFWLSAACGFALSASRTRGVVLASVPLSAFVLAALRLVPLYERVSLWVLPALYIGIALFADSAVRFARSAYVRRSWMHLAFAVVVALVGFQLCFDIFSRGKEDLQVGRPSDSNHQLDDRSGVRWLMQQRQPGDVVMTTHLALPAVWWYGDIPISGSDFGGSRQPGGSRIIVVGHAVPGPDCRRNELRDALKDQRRVLVYFGFRFDGVPEGFDNLLLDGLGELGAITAIREFADVGRAAVVELRDPASPDAAVASQQAVPPGYAPGRAAGCLTVRDASRW